MRLFNVCRFSFGVTALVLAGMCGDLTSRQLLAQAPIGGGAPGGGGLEEQAVIPFGALFGPYNPRVSDQHGTTTFSIADTELAVTITRSWFVHVAYPRTRQFQYGKLWHYDNFSPMRIIISEFPVTPGTTVTNDLAFTSQPGPLTSPFYHANAWLDVAFSTQ